MRLGSMCFVLCAIVRLGLVIIWHNACTNTQACEALSPEKIGVLRVRGGIPTLPPPSKANPTPAQQNNLQGTA